MGCLKLGSIIGSFDMLDVENKLTWFDLCRKKSVYRSPCIRMLCALAISLQLRSFIHFAWCLIHTNTPHWWAYWRILTLYCCLVPPSTSVFVAMYISLNLHIGMAYSQEMIEKLIEALILTNSYQLQYWPLKKKIKIGFQIFFLTYKQRYRPITQA